MMMSRPLPPVGAEADGIEHASPQLDSGFAAGAAAGSGSGLVPVRQRHASHEFIRWDQQPHRRHLAGEPFASLPSSPDVNRPECFAFAGAAAADVGDPRVELHFEHPSGESAGVLRMYGRCDGLPSTSTCSRAVVAAHRNGSTFSSSTFETGTAAGFNDDDQHHHQQQQQRKLVGHPAMSRSLSNGGIWFETNGREGPHVLADACASRGNSTSPEVDARDAGVGASGYAGSSELQQPFPTIGNGADNNNDPSSVLEACSICGDRATGKHYGASSCDGCKGFFRRSVRKHQKYSCRFKRTCPVDKERRNQCRYCRLMKCLRTGMKREAVQNERDRISSRRYTAEDKGGKFSIDILLRAEVALNQMGAHLTDRNLYQKRLATIEDVSESAAHQVANLVSWAKLIPAFADLTMNDKIALLKAHAGEHLLLGLTKRSLKMKDVLLLSNDTIIVRHSDEQRDLTGIGTRIMDELVDPLNEVAADDTEFACMRAFVFFDPYVKGIEDKMKVKEVRNEILLTLEDYVIADRMCEPRGRFGTLFGILLSLQSIKHQLIGEVVQYAKLFGKGKFDSLLQETLLEDNLPADEPPKLAQGYYVSLQQQQQQEQQSQYYNPGIQANDSELSNRIATCPGGVSADNARGRRRNAQDEHAVQQPPPPFITHATSFTRVSERVPVASSNLVAVDEGSGSGSSSGSAYERNYSNYGPRRNFLMQHQSQMAKMDDQQLEHQRLEGD